MTPYGAPLLLAAIVLLIVLAVMISLRGQARRDARRFGVEPPPITLQGRGTQSTRTLDLPAGQYRADYRFSDEWATAVFLISATTGDKDMLFYKTGSGSMQFSVDCDERAIIEVEPTAEHAEWWVEIRPWRALPTA